MLSYNSFWKICKKLGMSRVYTDAGIHVPVTILHLDNCHVVSTKTKAKDGYSSVQLGVVDAKDKHISKPMKGHFKKNNAQPKVKLSEFRVSEENLLENGSELSASHFVDGQYIDTGTSGKILIQTLPALFMCLVIALLAASICLAVILSAVRAFSP